MAMITPICSPIAAFDATSAYTFYFTSSGGDQVVANRLVIVTNDTTQSIVYNQQVTSYQFQQTVPAGTLSNGNAYLYYFITYDSSGNASANSNQVPFKCFATPIITFTNINNNDKISASTFTFNFTYSQNEGEIFNSLIVYLYTSTGTLFSQSTPIYAESGATVPINLSYTFSAMENKTSYYINVVGLTINNTPFQSSNVNFEINYSQPELYTQLSLTNMCDDGYVEISSNLIVAEGTGSGYTYVNEGLYPYYIAYPYSKTYPSGNWNYNDGNGITSTTYLDVSTKGSYVTWTSGFNLPMTFASEFYFKPISLGGFAILGNVANTDVNNIDLSGTLTFEIVRNIPYDAQSNGVKDYVVVKGYSDGVEKVYQWSNYIEPINQLSNVVVFFKKVRSGSTDTYTVEAQATYPEESMIIWGDSDTPAYSNIEFGKITNMMWKDTTIIGDQQTALADDMDTEYPLNGVTIYNGKYYGMFMTANGNQTISSTLPDLDSTTLLRCNFDNTINAGTLNIRFSGIQKIRIKRKLVGSVSWLTLYEKEINQIEDLENIQLQDSFLPSGYTFQYVLVPVLQGDIEGDYNIISSVSTNFRGIFISDNGSDSDNTTQTVYKLYNGVVFGDTTSYTEIGSQQPIGGVFPVIITNGTANYQNGTVSGDLYGYNFSANRTINRIDVVTQTNNFISFMKNGNAKIIKDWNGNIWLAKLSDSPKISYNSNFGMGVTRVSFNWVEQGKYDSQSDLYNNGLNTYTG